jgi:hypothetical protein
MNGWIKFGRWSPARLFYASLNSNLMCNPGREVRKKEIFFFSFKGKDEGFLDGLGVLLKC